MQRVSAPLQSPEERHSLTVEPTSMNPVSHVKMAVAPNVVWVPIFLPLAGMPRSPHEMTGGETGRGVVTQTGRGVAMQAGSSQADLHSDDRTCIAKERVETHDSTQR